MKPILASMRRRLHSGIVTGLITVAAGVAQAQEGQAAPEAPETVAQEGGAAAQAAAPTGAPDAPDAPLIGTPESIPVAAPSLESAAPVAPAAEARDDGTQRLDDVVVTATKREISVREIPASITAFSGEGLENQGRSNLIDYIQQSPGVVASQASPGFTRISMRGISTDTNPASINASPVGVFIGDTAFSDPYINNVVPDLSAFDLSGVQILKGPQGTLFGGAALSGAIRYELQEPVQGEWQLRGFTQYVDYYQGRSGFTSGVAVNAPLWPDQGLALRIGYVHRENPGIYTDTRAGVTGVDRGDGDQKRAILLWEPNEDWKIKLTHLDQDYSAANATTFADTPDGPRATHTQVLPNPSTNSFDLNSVEINYNFDSMRLVSLTSRTGKKALFSGDLTSALAGDPPTGYPPLIGIFLAVADKSRALSQELRLQSTGNGPFQWLVGGYFYDYRMFFEILGDTPLHQNLTGVGDLISTLPGVLANLGPLVNQTGTLLYGYNNAKSQERAVFTDLSYKLWDRLDLSAGARFYSTYVVGGFLGTGALILVENGGQTVDARNRIDEHGVSPKFSATYHYSHDISQYLSASRGFRFGGLQEVPSTATNGVPPVYKSDSLWNYESGLRTSWLDNSLHADVTVFYIRYINPIIQEATQGIPLNFDVNASAAISRGAEVSLQWRPPVDGLTLSLAGGITDAHLTETFTSNNGTVVQPGTQMPGAARSQYSGSALYLLPVGIFDLGGSLGYTYVGKGYSNLTHDVPINNFGVLDAGLSLSSTALSFHPRLSLNASNLLNKTVPVGGSVGTAIDQIAVNRAYTLNPPRTITARLSMEF